MNMFLLEMAQLVSSVIDTTGKEAAAAGTQTAAGPSLLTLLLVWGAVFLIFWFLVIRPQKKREKEMQEMQENIGVDDEIVTAGGLYGKVVAVWHDSFLVELGTNKGVTVPIRKDSIIGKAKPQMNEPVKPREEKEK